LGYEGFFVGVFVGAAVGAEEEGIGVEVFSTGGGFVATSCAM